MSDQKNDPATRFKLAQATLAGGDRDTAAAHFQAALSGYQARGQFVNVAACHYHLAIIAYTLGALADSESHNRQSLELYRRHERRQDEASVLGNLGATLQAGGRLAEAIAHYNEALTIARHLGDRPREASILGNLGAARFELGDLGEAEALWQEALLLARELGQRQTETNALTNLGVLHKEHSHYDLARHYLEAAYALSQAEDDLRGLFNQSSNLGNVYRHLGEYDRAAEWQQKALTLARQTGYPQGEVIALGNLGLVTFARADYPGALPFFQAALELAKALRYQKGEAAQWQNVAACYMMLNRLAEAEEALRHSIPLEEALGNQYGQMIALADLSYVRLLQGEPHAALSLVEQAWSLAAPVSGPELLARLCWSRADIYVVFGQMEAAYAAYRQAIQYMEAIRGQLQRETDRASFITVERARIFGKMVLILQQSSHQPQEAIAYAEKARSRLFLDQLSGELSEAIAEQVRGEPLSYREICGLLEVIN